jgi:threonine aldolase
MPSGVMAQSIALLIHSSESKRRFACHESSHLILHEQEAYQHLLHMDPIVIASQADGFRRHPLIMEDVKKALEQHHDETSALILELPHRELGGKCTPWQDIVLMRDYCYSNNIKLHCDGAQIFEATVGYDKSLREMAEPFDNVYISFYKGLGGLSGAMLLGSTTFCKEARIWLRRFGGNLYTLLPYTASALAGYRKYWVDDSSMTFRDKRDKLLGIVDALSCEDQIRSCVSFDPALPQVNMIHGYLFKSKQKCMDAVYMVESQYGIRLLSRLKDIETSDPAYRKGYRTKFEWTMGEANGAIDDDVFMRGWKEFATALEVTS